MARPIGTPRTTRLRKLECECGNIAYQSRARLSAGLLRCCCGREMIPADPDDAALVLSPERLETHPAVVRFGELAASAAHGQSGPARSLRSTGKVFRSPLELAAERLERETRENARATQRAALAAHVAPSAAQSDPIPF